jgi:hypothetical protein
MNACSTCGLHIVAGPGESCELCKKAAAAKGGYVAVVCSRCGGGYSATSEPVGLALCPTCVTSTYKTGGVVVGSSSVTIMGDGGWETVTASTPGTITVHYVDPWPEPFTGVVLDHGELDLGLEPVRGVGLTSMMLMDAAERKRAGLSVRIVVVLDREIDRMLRNPVLEDCPMHRGDFLTLARATQGGLRGHERSSVFVDHHVWEVGSPSYLDMLRLELQYLR